MLKWTRQQQRQSLHLLQHSTNSNSPLLADKPSKSLKAAARQRYSTGNFPNPKSNLKMPTMTHTLERRIHRRSMDNHLDSGYDEGGRHSRNSLTGNHNKENFGVHFMRQSFGNTSLTALQDLSNGKSPRRSSEDTPPPVLNIKRSNANIDSPITRNEPRFSDNFAEEDDITPLSRLRFRNRIKEDSLSSSKMGDVTLDRMLDAIIESARKEVKQVAKTQIQQQQEECKENVLVLDIDESIHEMEVRTPQHLKRQRVVRRKNPKNTDKKGKKDKEVEKHLKKREVSKKPLQTPKQREMIGLTLPNGIPSPETPTLQKYQTYNALLSMDTPPQQHLTFSEENIAQRCSTPTLGEGANIKRCLSFSLGSEEDEEAIYKRCSVASSIGSSTNEQLSGSCSSLSLTGNRSRGSVDVNIYMEKDNSILNVHVIRCRDLQRSNGASASSVNAYVKLALIRKTDNECQYFQRTAVHRNSSRPQFDQLFKFDLSDITQAVEEIDQDDRLQMAVWHRDRQLK